MPPSTVALADLSAAERERFFEFLVASKVDFAYDPFGERYVAKVRVVRPEARKSADRGRAPTAAPPRPPSGRSSSSRAASGSQRRAASLGGQPQPSRADSAPQRCRPLAAARQGPTGAMPSAPARPPKFADAAAMAVQEASLRTKYARLCGQLPPMAQPPKQMPYAELARFSEEAYSRAQEGQLAGGTAVDESGRRVALSLPRAVSAMASGRYGLPHMVAQTCWSVAASVDALRGQHRGIDLFGHFLDGSYDSVDLAFFLQVRSASQQVVKAEVNRAAKHILQVEVDARRAIQVIREGVRKRELQVAVLLRLDEEMAAAETSTLSVETLWVVAIEEFAAASGRFKIPDDPSPSEVWDGLDPELQQRAEQMTERVVAALAAQGESPPEAEEARDWAMRSVARGQPQPVGEADLADTVAPSEAYHVSPESLQQAWEGFHAGGSEEGSAEADFDLEQCVQERLAIATQDLVAEVIAALEAPGDLRAALSEEFCNVTDTLLEAFVNDDYAAWLETLGVEGPGTSRQRDHYDVLRQDFQDALSQGMSIEAVDQICKGVVSTPELVNLVKACVADAGQEAQVEEDGEGQAGEEGEPHPPSDEDDFVSF